MLEFCLSGLHSYCFVFRRMITWQFIFVNVVNWMYCLELIKFDVFNSNTCYYVEVLRKCCTVVQCRVVVENNP